MFPDNFYEHHDHLHQKIRQHFELARQYFDVESLHQLRVEIKRLRAFFDLIAVINPNFHAKRQFKKIRKFFKAAGLLRDVHVQQELVRSWSLQNQLELSEYYNFLKQREMALRPQFLAAARQFDFDIFQTNEKLIRALMQYLPADYVEGKSKKQLDELIKKLHLLKSQPAETGVDFHQIRINAKAARYTLEIFQLCFPNERLNLLNAKLHEMHRALGKWHDAEVGLTWLESFLESQDAASFFSHDSYMRLQEGLANDKKMRLGEFENCWNEFANLDLHN
jgi:CHAD domain-containing protein